jgi:hypothetical protein
MPIRKIIGGAVDYTVQNRLNEKSFQRNKDHYWETWNASNRYNSPVEVMGRMKEAGLNPALMYGSSSSAASTPTSQGDIAKHEPVQMPGNSALQYAQMQLMDKQGDREETQSALNATTGALNIEKSATETKRRLQIDYQNAKTDAEKREIEQRLKYADKLSEMSLAFQAQQINTMGASENKMNMETKRMDLTTMSYVAQEKKKVEKLQSEIDFNKQNLTNLQAETMLKRLDAIIKTVKADAAQQGIDYTDIWSLSGSLMNSIGKAEKRFTDLFRSPEKRKQFISEETWNDYNKWKKNKNK